jgi:coniferyl-aldehyde dehydrogenase
MTTAETARADKTSTRFHNIFDLQKKASRAVHCPPVQSRMENLEKLEKLLEANQDAIAEAINKDFGNRSHQESRLLELYLLITGCHYTRKHLKGWAKPRKRKVGLAFAGARNTVVPQPKGVVGVVAPWNYPLFLALGPCISALAAGNRCIVKMATNSQNLCRLLASLIRDNFDEDTLAIVPGVSAAEFTDKPWDHLVFTGSPETGKTVMATAARYLTPVTLELGGKSPCIIADDFNLDLAAKRILLTKFLNAGQTCVAPDHLFVPRDRMDEFVEMAREIVSGRYSSASHNDFTAIIDQNSYDRLKHNIEDATEKGARVISLLNDDADDDTGRKLSPRILVDVTPDMRIMQEEIFGPLMPVLPYDSIEEVIDYINSNERPLALYLYTYDRNLEQQVLENTLSGGVCVNDCAFHVAQHDMPFGGIGNSGMGHYHGEEGFLEFSKMRPVFKQSRVSGILALAPPFGQLFEKMYSLMLRHRL